MNSEITYTRIGDYYMPNLALQQQEEINLGKYARLRLNYLKNHRKAEYTIMLMNNTLQSHLIDIDEIAKKRINTIVEYMAKSDGTDENLKAQDQLKWTGLMNNYKHCAEEIVLKDFIYC